MTFRIDLDFAAADFCKSIGEFLSVAQDDAMESGETRLALVKCGKIELHYILSPHGIIRGARTYREAAELLRVAELRR